MRRNATGLAAVSLVLVLSGCALFQKKQPVQLEPALSSLDDYAATVQEPASTGGDLYPSFQPEVTMTDNPTPTDFGLSPDTGLAQYHTVTKGDTLYALARHYYSNQRRWKDIYDANRGSISDPNRISVVDAPRAKEPNQPSQPGVGVHSRTDQRTAWWVIATC